MAMDAFKTDSLKKAPLGPLLGKAFFDRSVHDVAPELIGATMLFDGVGGVIVETEAYHPTDPASHAYRRQTPRNGSMFGPAGYAYVYRSYGIHWCVNFVCEAPGLASAVLVRALVPTHGLGQMQQRRGLQNERMLCSGPGKLCAALGITGAHDGMALDQLPFAMHERVLPPEMVVGVRIGITKGVDLPWRFGLKDSRFVSRRF